MAAAARHIALYPGTFDPPTFGHLDVLRRSRGLFDAIVLGIGCNPDKAPLIPIEERLDIARSLVGEMVQEDPDQAPVTVDAYDGLTVDFARRLGACAIIRGVRNVTDLTAECQLAITNRQLADIETVFIVTGEPYAFTSSSLIRQVVAQGGSVDRLTHLVPPLVLERMRLRLRDGEAALRRFAHDRHID